jgi:hypothetical protein
MTIVVLYITANIFFLAIQTMLGLGEDSGVSQVMTVTASGLVVACVQVAKWSGVSDKRGPLFVVGFSLLITVFLAWTRGNFGRTTAFDYFAVFVNILLAAAGVFGFTRAAPGAVSSFTPPPGGGAGSSPTVK